MSFLLGHAEQNFKIYEAKGSAKKTTGNVFLLPISGGLTPLDDLLLGKICALQRNLNIQQNIHECFRVSDERDPASGF